MAEIFTSRKRARSQEDCDYTVQAKQFINEQTLNRNSETKMKEIHGKSIPCTLLC